MAKRGRESTYSKHDADAICLAIKTPIKREDGTFTCRGLRAICEELELNLSSVMRWLNDEKNVYFREQYALAREAQAEMMADEMMEIGEENPQEETTVKSKGGNEYTTKRTDGAGVQRNRLRVDVRKWVASKLLPKKYGDKLDVSGSVAISLGDELKAARERSGVKE